MHIHLDPVGGLAGDMFVAALLDAFPPLEERAQIAVRAAGLPSRFRCEVVRHRDHVLHGRRFAVIEDRAGAPAPASGAPPPHHHQHGHHLGDHAPDHAHGHRPFTELRARLAGSALSEGVRQTAIAIFESVAEAEADVHGATIDTVTFHELGEWDSIADIVAAAALIDALGAATWSLGALPLGAGFVPSAHGIIPVPAPATAYLLRGLPVRDDGIGGERVTPTGAAIARHLVSRSGTAPRERRLLGTGLGFGTRTLPGVSNCVRALVFEGVAPRSIVPGTEPAGHPIPVTSIEFEVDDQSPEDLAIGLDHLRDLPAVLDVLQTPAFGKKGRVVVCVRVLCRADAEDEVAAACFEETTTLGLRLADVRRHTLSRARTSLQAAGRELNLKVAERGGGATAKVEAESLRGVRGHAERERLRRLAAYGTGG